MKFTSSMNQYIDAKETDPHKKAKIRKAFKKMAKKPLSSTLSKGEVVHMFRRIINRENFKYNFLNVIEYLFRCVCYRNPKKLAKSKLKRHYYL